MQELTCRCGASKKRFRFDIGPFYIGECCESAGYDALGNLPKSDGVKQIQKALGVGVESGGPLVVEDLVPLGPSEGEAPEASPEPTGFFNKLFRAGGRGVLMEKRAEEIRAMAKEKGISGWDTLNKKQLVDLILAKK